MYLLEISACYIHNRVADGSGVENFRNRKHFLRKSEQDFYQILPIYENKKLRFY
jgi:hypothetical protein